MSLLYSIRRFFRPTEDTTHPFDRRHRVDTSGLIYPDRLATGSPADALSEGYYATAPSLFCAIVALWRRHATRPLTSYAFVDLGCGKGRVLLMASTYPFQSVSGIELNAKLAETARRNTARWLSTRRACPMIDVLTGDALSDPLATVTEDVPAVLFLFNSFGEEAVRQLARCLTVQAQKRTAPIDLLYLHPDHDDALKESGYLQTLADEDIAFSDEDAAADAFQVATDRCKVYRVVKDYGFTQDC